MDGRRAITTNDRATTMNNHTEDRITARFNEAVQHEINRQEARDDREFARDHARRQERENAAGVKRPRSYGWMNHA